MVNARKSVPHSVVGNIETVLAMEKRAERGGSLVWRFAHRFGSFVGSITFIAIHAVAFIAWLVINRGHWPRLVFDPYPFALLGMLVSFESVVLTTFVLIKQNREGDRADQRSHLDLQVNLLSEKEITKVLQIVQRISERVGAEKVYDAELEELLADTAIQNVAEELEGKAGEG
jgi:uncharacterized membrane protein